MCHGDARPQWPVIAPDGTVREAIVGDRVLQGPLFSEWASACRMTMRLQDLPIADFFPVASSPLSLKTPGVTFAIVAPMKGLCQVSLDLVSDRLGCPSVLNAAFVTEMNLAFDRIENGGGAEDAFNNITECVVAWYENMARIEMEHAEKAALHLDAERNSLEHFLLGIVGRVITWSDLGVRRRSRIANIYAAYCTAHERAGNLQTEINNFQYAPACFTCFVLPFGVIMPPLLSLRQCTESTRSWTLVA